MHKSKLGCILLDLAENGRELNKFFNLALPKNTGKEWYPTERGGLQSRCSQTSEMIDALFNGVEFKNGKLSYTKINYILDKQLLNSVDFFKFLDLLKTLNYSQIINIKIRIPPTKNPNSKNGFPGHVFNILINQGDIFVSQSFIYSYNMKIFYTNDFNELNKYLINFSGLLFSSSKFQKNDEKFYKNAFGVDMLNYDNQNLADISIPKPQKMTVRISTSNFNILQSSIQECIKMNLYLKRNMDLSYYKKIHYEELESYLKIKILNRFVDNIIKVFLKIYDKNGLCLLNDRYNEITDGKIPYSLQSTKQNKNYHLI